MTSLITARGYAFGSGTPLENIKQIAPMLNFNTKVKSIETLVTRK
jgi:hypothetical protein